MIPSTPALIAFNAVDAFQHQHARPFVAKNLHVVPVQIVLTHDLMHVRIGAQRAAIRFRIVFVPRHADRGKVFHQHVREPLRVFHDVPGETQVRAERNLEAVLGIIFAVRRDDGVGGDDQRLEPVVLGALDQPVGQVALLPDIKLEPQAKIRLLGDFFHRGHGAGRQCERDFGFRGCLGQFQLAFMPAQAGRAGGGDRHWHGNFLAEQGGFGGAVRYVHQRPVP